MMEEKTLVCSPIGYFHGMHSEKYMAPKQAELGPDGNHGVIILDAGCNYEQALQDLEGFEHIWIVYWFDRNESWKPKVTTPRQGPKRGVFATRSPHRPNPIGLSCVRLLGIEGRKVVIGKNDLLDGTPILDIKPYLAYADAFPESRQGWIEETSKNMYQVDWLPGAMEQAKFIEDQLQMQFIDTVNLRLADNPFPFKNHRIRKVGEGEYELAVKTWRVRYLVECDAVAIQKIVSGYDQETLDGIKVSKWDDVPVHNEFLQKFSR